MKILLISYTADVHHGWGNITHEYCKALQKKGIAFTLLLPENEPHRETIDYPCEYVLPPYTTTLRHRFLWKYLSYRLPPRFQGYTLIHNLFDFPYCYLAYRLSQQLRLRYITGSQGTYGVLPLFRWLDCSLQKKSYNHAYKIITPSRYTALLIEKFSQTPTPFQVIHNGVHWERFASPVPPEKIQAIRNQYPGQFLVLGVGGLKKRKGFHIVLKALTFLREKPIKYLIIGKGIMEKELRELVAQEKLENQVEFLGQRGGEDLVSYFQACDLYCHTPINEDFHFEGFGIVFVEANAAGKPVVASASGGVTDAVSVGKSGVLVPEKDPQATARALLEFFENQERLKTMSQAALLWAQEHDWSRIADQYLKIYKELHW